jgi:hypothetical protein
MGVMLRWAMGLRFGCGLFAFAADQALLLALGCCVALPCGSASAASARMKFTIPGRNMESQIPACRRPAHRSLPAFAQPGLTEARLSPPSARAMR